MSCAAWVVGIGADDTKLSSSVTIVVVMYNLLNCQGRNVLKSNPRVMSEPFRFACSSFSLQWFNPGCKTWGFSLKWNQSENQSKFPPFPNLEGLVCVRFQQQKMWAWFQCEKGCFEISTAEAPQRIGDGNFIFSRGLDFHWSGLEVWQQMKEALTLRIQEQGPGQQH